MPTLGSPIALGHPIALGRTAEIYPWENNCILKLTRAGFPAYLADQEWRQSEAAWKLGAPAPRPVALVEVGSLRGDPSGDVANMCLWIRSALMFGSGPKGWLARQLGRRFERVFLDTYLAAHGPLEHLQDWLAILAACRMNEENRAILPHLERILALQLKT